MTKPAVLIVPGLRDHAAQHWQTLLAAELPRVRCVPPMGRERLDCAARVEAIEREAQAIEGPLVVVAHSAGTIMVAHWARRTTRRVLGALLATPPDFERPMPEGYPTLDALREGGWLPVPRGPLPFASIVAASRNDPLAEYGRVARLANDWGSSLVDLGEVGHLNPASGFGSWQRAHEFIDRIAATRQAASDALPTQPLPN
ncbi:MAG TPA: alpha/beta hydrolase [Ramlibacter sp.]|uniref:RBBP9/YdeN family alpha/beta hydrolase n=1 Tax=Ramlibacter sp. TaxID=1917967 RepID=UPI002C4EF8E6|nr:alpha/beta hydrolase [Ramlibacter sp.]HVZ45913.1 alpha/beta hydrolase [Ramlibacter sp.]